jgi:START domain-containing protein
MLRFLVYLLLTANCLLLTVYGFSQNKRNDWRLYKNENGIAIYERISASSQYREIKSVLTLKTSLNSIVALINDWETYPQWNYKCGESKTLKKISETELIHYQTTIVPWPAQDQDLVINIKLSQDEKTRTVTIKSTNNPNYIPPIKDRTRVEEFYGIWTLTPLTDGTVQVTYQFRVKPGGYIPVWLVNMAALYGPYETMYNFKQWIVKDKYQKAKSTFIKELTD